MLRKSKQSIIALAYDELSLDPAFYNAEGIIGIPKNEILLKGVKDTRIQGIIVTEYSGNSKTVEDDAVKVVALIENSLRYKF